GFVDFIQRVSALNTIAEKDKELLNKQKKDKLTVEKKADSLQKALSTLEDDLNKLKALKVELEDKKEEKRKVMSKYKEKEGQLETSL
ncbi:peptidase M23, partial [Planococcus sp. SIMBA_143]